MNKKSSIDFAKIKAAAAGRWAEIIPALTGLSSEVLRKGKADHPCPRCNGQTVIWPDRDAEQTGSMACRKCTNDKPTGDGIATVAVWNGISQGEAAGAVASHLGMSSLDVLNVSRHVDLIEQICREKRMPIEAFKQFGPTVVKRGRGRQDCVRVPLYNETGAIHSHFDFVPGHKGFNACGKGMSGMFFPGRLPQPGETWVGVEGGKDSPALVGLGYLAFGSPTSTMAAKYASLFRGCHVILVPDLDTTGQEGAQKTGGRLFGIAESVRIARLPGEIFASGGDDVRDVLSRDGGEQLVRAAIDTAQPWQPREGEHRPNDGRPEVLVTLAYGYCCDQVTEHLGRLGWDSPWIPAPKREALKVYQRGGMLVQVVNADDAEQLQGVDIPEGTARIRPLPNGQVPPNSTHVTEPMVAELLDIFDTMRMLVSTLGYPVFEPIVKPSAPSHLFYVRGGGSDGKGELVEDGFVVFEGSLARIEVAPSGAHAVNPHREGLLAAGVVEERDGEYVFTQDFLFSSPSTAAAVVLGRSANGWIEWKDERGQTLSPHQCTYAGCTRVNKRTDGRIALPVPGRIVRCLGPPRHMAPWGPNAELKSRNADVPSAVSIPRLLCY